MTMHFVVYLDEFGHDGKYVGRADRQYKASPIFGLGGFALPANRVRSFATWFFKLKCRLLDWEIQKSGEHPAKWEKKGSALYTTRNVVTYPELRQATNRLINKIHSEDGFIFYHGIEKYNSPKGHDAKALYKVTLTKAMRKLDAAFQQRRSTFTLMIDEHENRAEHVEAASKTMFGAESVGCLIEPPIQAESHLYQTLQCADWICGLIGRLGAYRIRADEYADLEWSEKFFGERIEAVTCFSSIQKKRLASSRRLPDTPPHTAMSAAFTRAYEAKGKKNESNAEIF